MKEEDSPGYYATLDWVKKQIPNHRINNFRVRKNIVKNQHVIQNTIVRIICVRRKPWSRGRELGSQSEGRGFNPCPMLDGSGVKTMPGSIPTPSSGSL